MTTTVNTTDPDFGLGNTNGDHSNEPTPQPEWMEPAGGASPTRTSNGSVEADAEGYRALRVTAASAIKPRPVHWIWDGRLAAGTLALIAGREGLGKSTLVYDRAARITRGELPGIHLGHPKSVLVAATEDSWERTIVPRLIAADADLDRIFRVEVETALGVTLGITLPRDVSEVERLAGETDAAALIMDPLMSRLGHLDTHRDAEVRLALEPIAAAADRCGLVVLGLIHHNKSGTSDPLNLVMASKAFTAVARSVHTVIPDPDDETEERRLFGTPKNNLGRLNLPTLSFTIVTHEVPTEEGPAYTGRLVWGDDVDGTIADALARVEDPATRTATQEAADWLSDYLTTQGGTASSGDIKRAARVHGHAERTLQNARKRLRLDVVTEGFPRQSWWSLPGTQIPASRATPPGESAQLT